MAKVIDANLSLEAIRCEPSGECGHPSIIDEHVDLRLKLDYFLTKRFDRGSISEVKKLVVDLIRVSGAQLGQSSLRNIYVPITKDDSAPVLKQLLHCRLPYPLRCSCDDCHSFGVIPPYCALTSTEIDAKSVQQKQCSNYPCQWLHQCG